MDALCLFLVVAVGFMTFAAGFVGGFTRAIIRYVSRFPPDEGSDNNLDDFEHDNGV